MGEVLLSAGAAYDSRSLDGLKQLAKQDRVSGLQAAAKQMEGLFVQMMLKSMRDATPKGGMFDSQQADMFTSMLDQQLSQDIAAQGKLGFADLMLKNLGGKAASPAASEPATAALTFNRKDHITRPTAPLYALQDAAHHSVSENAPAARRVTGPVRNNASFVSRLSAPAMAASQRSGVPHQLIIAQAALESGWGNREIPTKDGKPSYNLFGIKATGNWKGESTEITTTEYIGGVAKKVKAAFRVYHSYTEALSDYADMLTNNPRYKKVIEAATPEKAAHALQAGGYATDPEYANKLINIINQVKGNLNHAVNAYKSDLSSLF